MKKSGMVVALLFLVAFSTVSMAADKCGPEWDLGSAIQVAPTGSSNPVWPDWKGKLGTCDKGNVSFSDEVYFYSFPTAEKLTSAFGAQVHADPWLIVPEKNRTFFVFESDWQRWYEEEEKKRAGTRPSINLLLFGNPLGPLPPDPNVYPNNVVFTPEKSNPNANEPDLILSDKAWQRTYVTGEVYAQIEVRTDGTAKMKFGRLISANTVRWFDIRRNIPVSADWYEGITPFILSDMLTGYIFKDEFYPGDDRDIWTARVFIPGYMHTTWTPANPNPLAVTEGNINLSGTSWQNMHPVGSTYCQIAKRDDGTFKIKFGKVQNGYVEIFNRYNNLTAPAGWTRGQAPICLPCEFPEYKFGPGSDPGDNTDVWTARVWIPGYNL